MRIALVVGINYYEHIGSLHGCANDAQEVKAVLAHNGDGTMNFDCMPLVATGSETRITRGVLKDRIGQLFATESEINLLYFAGHGHIEATGGYLLTSEAQRGDDGLALSEVLTLALQSKSRNRIIVLDSCHSGIAGNPPSTPGLAILEDGMTVLTASTQEQYATEENGRGLFTSLFVDGLYGGAANLAGDVTPGSIYAHIDQSLGGWEQRPVFKTNVKQFVSLRHVPPRIPLEDLRRIKEFFPRQGTEFVLDPTFEPEMKGRDPGMPEPIPANVEVLGILQQFNRHGLLVPVNAKHMWNATMEGKSCRLTALGEHYLRLALKGLI